LYVLFAHVMTGLVPYKFVGDAKPAATVLLWQDMTFTNWINRSYLSRLYLSNVGNVNGTKPCLYTMSKDGLLQIL
jgi:hypothetical protein